MLARRVLLTLGSLAILWTAGFTGLAGAGANGDVIQPGDRVNGNCTMNFVYDGVGALAGRVYIGTAAHCVDAVGQDASTPSFDDFGDVAFIGDAGPTERDYAFIEVRPAFHAFVSAEVRGHAGMPTGSTTSGQTGTGDVLLFSGWGTGFSNTAPGREMRVGLLTSDNAARYRVEGPVSPGDSGGPVLHQETGRAIGIVSRIVAGCCEIVLPTWNEGATVQGIIADAGAHGFTVQLRTV